MHIYKHRQLRSWLKDTMLISLERAARQICLLLVKPIRGVLVKQGEGIAIQSAPQSQHALGASLAIMYCLSERDNDDIP